MEIDKEKILKAFDAISEGNDYITTLAHAATLFAYLVDEKGRKNPKDKQINMTVMSNMLSSPYNVGCREENKSNNLQFAKSCKTCRHYSKDEYDDRAQCKKIGYSDYLDQKYDCLHFCPPQNFCCNHYEFQPVTNTDADTGGR